MSTEYSAKKLLDRNAKKQRVKFISSKVQRLNRPRRPRCETVNTSGHKTAPRQETVHCTKIPVGEVRPPRSRTQATMLGHPPQVRVTSQSQKKIAQTHWKPRHPRTQTLRSETIPKVSRTPVTAELPEQRSCIQREQPTKSSSPPAAENVAASNRKPSCIPPSNYPRNTTSRVLFPRPTRKRPVTSCAALVSRSRQVSTWDLNALNSPLLRFFKAKVSLPQEEINQNSKVVNSVLLMILEKIRTEDEIFSLKQLNTGSYYEKLRVSSPEEFDVMLVFEAHLIRRFFKVKEYCRDHPGFAKLVFNDCIPGGRERWGNFLSRDGKFLSPEKLMRRFYELIQRAVRSSPHGRRNLKIEQHGPAVTLTIDGKIDLDLVLSVEVLEWPSCAKGWGSTSRAWPSTVEVEQIKMKEPKFYLVAKPCPDKQRALTDSRLFWRISFSEAEKTLLKSASSDKKYYRITKAIYLAKKSSLKPLTSFHLKNLFLHCRSEHPRAKHDDSNLGESVVRFFQSLIDCLKRGSLQHFFVNRRSLLSEMTEAERRDVVDKLTRYLKELVQNPKAFLEKLHYC